MGDLSDFQRGQTVDAPSTGAFVITTVTSLGVSGAAVAEVMATYTGHGKTSSAERNSGRNPKLSERDRRTLKKIVSKNHRTVAAEVTAEVSIHHEDPVSTQAVQRELYKSNIHGRAAIPNSLLLKTTPKVETDVVMIIKPGYSDDWKYVMWW